MAEPYPVYTKAKTDELFPKGVVGTPTDGQVWTYDSSALGGAGAWVPKTPAASGGSGTPNPGYISGANLEWVSTSSVRLTPGSAMIAGTLLSWSSALTLTGITGAANTIRYVYISASGSSATLSHSTTAPVYDPALDYWRGSTASLRCVGYVYLGLDAGVKPFACTPVGRSREVYQMIAPNGNGANHVSEITLATGAGNSGAWQMYSLAPVAPAHATHYFAAGKISFPSASNEGILGISPVDLGAINGGFALFTVRDASPKADSKTFFGRVWMPISESQRTYARVQNSSGSVTYDLECHGARFGV